MPKPSPRLRFKNPAGSWSQMALDIGLVALSGLVMRAALERAFFAVEVDVHLVLTAKRPMWSKLDAYTLRYAKFLRDAGALMPAANLRMRVPVSRGRRRAGTRDVRIDVRLSLPARTTLASAVAVLHRLEQLAQEAMPLGAQLEGAMGSFAESLRAKWQAPWYGAVEEGFTAAPVFESLVRAGEMALGRRKNAPKRRRAKAATS